MILRSTLALGGALTLLACGGASGGLPGGGNPVGATNIAALPGTLLEAACSPTGKEICFNAKDDNCNGVVDEGCGVNTGVLQFTIAWGDSKADVDLLVTDPTGQKVFEGARNGKGGLVLDKDCPDETGCHGQNIENIYFPGPEPPKGRYKVEVVLKDLRGASSPVEVRLGVRVGSRTFGAMLHLQTETRDDKTRGTSPRADTGTLTFDL